MIRHLYKGPIRFLQPILEKLLKETNLELAQKIPSINKWTDDDQIDNDTSNNPTITNSQITQLLKFRYG